MSKSITFNVEPNETLRRNLRKGYLIDGPLREYLSNTSDLVASTARRDAPRDLGKLAKSHTWTVDPAEPPTWGRVDVNAVGPKGAPYPLFVHEGTRPHFPPVDAITPWAERHGIPPFALALAIARHGTRANPWLQRTVDSLRSRLRNLNKLKEGITRRWNP